MPDLEGAEELVRPLPSRFAPGEGIVTDPGGDALARVTLPCRLRFHGGRVWITDEGGKDALGKTHPDFALIRGLQGAHRFLSEGSGGPHGRPGDLKLAGAPKSPYHRNLCRLAFLAPDIQRLIVEGRQPLGLTLARLLATPIPPSWEAQRQVFDIPC
jgi:hypothetical protein